MKTLSLTDGTNTFTWANTFTGSVLQAYEGFEYPSTRTVMEDVPSRDGAVYIRGLMGRRRLSWTSELIGTSATNMLTLRRNMEMVCKPGTLKTLKFTTYDDLELQTEVEILDIRAQYRKAYATVQVEAVAPDPRFYAQTESSESTGVTTSGSGFTIPATIPISFVDTGGTPRLAIVGSGNISSPATFEITGPGTNFIVLNTTSGDSFDFNTTLTSETVTIDTVNRTVIKGANQNVYGSFDGDFWYVPVGTSNIHFNASSGTDSNTQLTVSWRDAYLGV